MLSVYLYAIYLLSRSMSKVPQGTIASEQMENGAVPVDIFTEKHTPPAELLFSMPETEQVADSATAPSPLDAQPLEFCCEMLC